MMRRALLRQAQSAAIGRSIQPRTSFLQTPARWSGQTPRRRAASAWFSSATESGKSDAQESSTSSQASSERIEDRESGKEDPVKKELEAKNREVIDLKVRVAVLQGSLGSHLFMTLSTVQIQVHADA